MAILRYSLLTLALFLSSPPSLQSAEIFRWVDERGVVHFTDNLGNIPEKDRLGATRIQAKESPIIQEAPKAPDKASVPIAHKGQVVVVQATLNEKASASFVVDTGASYTMISRAVARELAFDLGTPLPTIPFQTANGVIQAPLISLEWIDVGGMKVKDLTVAVHDVFPDPSISGLLGLNFLSNFRLDIDTKNGLLHLEKK